MLRPVVILSADAIRASFIQTVAIVAGTVASFALVMGCSSGAGGDESQATGTSSATASATEASAGSFCTAYCEKASSCDTSQDSQTCTELCETELTSTIKKLRDDVIKETKACWQRSDCRQVLSANRIKDCIDEAAVNAAPTPAARGFCDALGVAFRKCDGSSSYADCLSATKIFGDDTLEQAQKCTTKSCSTMSTCINATL